MVQWRKFYKFQFFSKVLICLVCLAIVVLFGAFEYWPSIGNDSVTVFFFHLAPPYSLIMFAMIVMYIMNEESSNLQVIICHAIGIILFIVFIFCNVFVILRHKADDLPITKELTQECLHVGAVILIIADLIVTLTEPSPTEM